jgi:hypothetical protein
MHEEATHQGMHIILSMQLAWCANANRKSGEPLWLKHGGREVQSVSKAASVSQTLRVILRPILRRHGSR